MICLCHARSRAHAPAPARVRDLRIANGHKIHWLVLIPRWRTSLCAGSQLQFNQLCVHNVTNAQTPTRPRPMRRRRRDGFSSGSRPHRTSAKCGTPPAARCPRSRGTARARRRRRGPHRRHCGPRTTATRAAGLRREQGGAGRASARWRRRRRAIADGGVRRSPTADFDPKGARARVRLLLVRVSLACSLAPASFFLRALALARSISLYITLALARARARFLFLSLFLSLSRSLALSLSLARYLSTLRSLPRSFSLSFFARSFSLFYLSLSIARWLARSINLYSSPDRALSLSFSLRRRRTSRAACCGGGGGGGGAVAGGGGEPAGGEAEAHVASCRPRTRRFIRFIHAVQGPSARRGLSGVRARCVAHFAHVALLTSRTDVTPAVLSLRSVFFDHF